MDVYGTHYSDSDLGEEESLSYDTDTFSSGEMSGSASGSNALGAWSIDVDSSGTVTESGTGTYEIDEDGNYDYSDEEIFWEGATMTTPAILKTARSRGIIIARPIKGAR